MAAPVDLRFVLNAMSRTRKDLKKQKELNEVLRGRKGGPMKDKKKEAGPVVCPDCGGIPDAMCDSEGRCWTCPTCDGAGEILE